MNTSGPWWVVSMKGYPSSSDRAVWHKRLGTTDLQRFADQQVRMNQTRSWKFMAIVTTTHHPVWLCFTQLCPCALGTLLWTTVYTSLAISMSKSNYSNLEIKKSIAVVQHFPCVSIQQEFKSQEYILKKGWPWGQRSVIRNVFNPRQLC